MRRLIYILAIMILANSCTTGSERATSAIVDFNPLPLPSDSTVLYFNKKVDRNDTTENRIDSVLNRWYSKMLFALDEPVLSNYRGERKLYRFTWLRTFNHPVSVRIEKQDGMSRLFSRVSDGAGGYEPGKFFFDTTFNLTHDQSDSINAKLDGAQFWALRTDSINSVGKDGSTWIVEAYKNHKYHVVVRWSPERGTPFRAIGEYLFSISQIKGEMVGRDGGNY